MTIKSWITVKPVALQHFSGDRLSLVVEYEIFHQLYSKTFKHTSLSVYKHVFYVLKWWLICNGDDDSEVHYYVHCIVDEIEKRCNKSVIVNSCKCYVEWFETVTVCMLVLMTVPWFDCDAEAVPPSLFCLLSICSMICTSRNRKGGIGDGGWVYLGRDISSPRLYCS